MIIVGFRRMLTKIFMKKLTKVIAKQTGKRDKDGNLVLKESKATVVMSAILFVIVLASSIFLFITADYSQFKTMIAAVGAVLIIAFIFLFIGLKVLGKVITEDSVINKSLIGKKVIKFDSIEKVEGKNNGNNARIILRGNGKKIIIPTMLNGFNEFFEILEKKVGEEKCKAAKLAIAEFIR